MLKILGWLAVDGNFLFRARMDEFQTRGMKSHAIDQRLRRFCAVIFSVANYRMPHNRKLRADLILQSGHQLHANQGRVGKKPFDRIVKFGAGRVRISRSSQLLKHPLAAEMVNECVSLGFNASAQGDKVLPDGRVSKELTNQFVTIGAGLRKQQDAGGKAVDAMYDVDALPLELQPLLQKRQGGYGVRALDRHRQEPGWLVENDDGIVFVED